MSAISNMVDTMLHLQPVAPQPKIKSRALGPKMIEAGIEIEAMREQGMTNQQIAEAMGRPVKSVTSIWSQYRRIQ